jgi:hypothetical protein
MSDSSWTSALENATPILTNPGHSGMTGMTYVQALGRYIMVVWYYHHDSFSQAIQEKDLGTTLEFFEAGKPWGPWTRVKSFDTSGFGWYTPIIGQRFQAAMDRNTVTAYLYATGASFHEPDAGADTSLYKLNYLKITLSTKPLDHNRPAYIGSK